MDYVVDPALFAVSWPIMVDIVCLTCTNLVLYGLYIVLFVFSIRTLARRNIPGRRLFMGTTIVMFLLGTCGTFVVVAMAGVSIRITKAVVQGSTDLPYLTGPAGYVLWVISLTTLLNYHNGEFAAIFSGITGGLVTQTANIAPTLIFVRVGMGRQWTRDTIPIGERLSPDDDIKFRVPVQPAESYPVIEIK
ncbi:hypothetical protein B0H19DRAFT_1256763 [Mycena capillaripes]|nr:hypothetical protein B0H19DRAFT_1256763 [Mycena capillaripes]